MSKKRILTNRKGYWSKQINGVRYYFGNGSYDDALGEYETRLPYIQLGIEVPDGSKVTVGRLLNAFLSNRLDRLDDGDLSKQTYDDYVQVCDLISESIPTSTPLESLRADHFDVIRKRLGQGKVKKKVSPKTLDRRLGYARAIFRFASTDNRLITFQLPFTEPLACVRKREIRKHKASKPARLLTPYELNIVIDHASTKFKAIILLAINGGFNNSDICHIEASLFDPMPEFLEYPRRKTFFMRKTPLWPETIEAINAWLQVRPDCKLMQLFFSQQRLPYSDYGRHDQISKTFYRYLNDLKIYQEGKNFGAIRTTFANVAKEVGDDVAVKALMGHSDGSELYESYANGVYEPRLKKVTDHVRSWLFSSD